MKFSDINVLFYCDLQNIYTIIFVFPTSSFLPFLLRTKDVLKTDSMSLDSSEMNVKDGSAHTVLGLSYNAYMWD